MCNQYHKSNCFIFWKNNYTENKLIKCYSNSKQNCLRVNPLYKPNHELSSLNNPMQHTIKKSKTPQGIEPRPNKWECHHRSLLLFCCCCKGKSKTWRNKRIVPPGKENPFTMAATLSRHEGTFRDTRLQLEDRTTGFPPQTPALPTTLHWQLIPCFLPYYWHDTTIPGDTQVALLLKFCRSRGTRKDSDDFLAYFAAVNGERETIYVPSPRPNPWPVLQEHVFHKMVIGYHKRQAFTAVIHPRRRSILPSQEIRRYPSGRCTKSSRLPICHPVR